VFCSGLIVTFCDSIRNKRLQFINFCIDEPLARGNTAKRTRKRLMSLLEKHLYLNIRQSNGGVKL